MVSFFKKNWDIFGGIIIGLSMSALEKFQLYSLQVSYSVFILIVMNIAVLRMIKQSGEARRKERRSSIIDTIVDGQKAVKVMNIAQNPTKAGEVLGCRLIKFWEELKNIMKQFKTFFDKFKGIDLAIALGILTVIEMYGGYINELFGDKLVIKGVAILPYITLGASVVVGIISNGFTKEQKEKIKALFSKSSTNELILAEIKKTIKDKSEKLSQFKKILSAQEVELENFENELVNLDNSYNAKKEMYCMIPQLASEEDVQLAHNAVAEAKAKIEAKKAEIEATRATVDELNKVINALKAQL